MHVERLLAAAGFILLSAVTAMSEVLVDWGGNYVTAVRNLTLPAASDTGKSRLWPFSWTAPIHPITEYPSTSGGTLAGPEFFGAIQHIDNNTGPSLLVAYRVVDQSTPPNDEIRIWGAAAPTVGENWVRGFLFFKPTLAPDETLRLSPSDYLAVKFERSGSGTRNVRLVLRNEDTWYLSALNMSSAGSFTNSSLDQAMWGIWNPGATDLAEGSISYNVAGSTFKDIKAYGVYFNIKQINTSAPRFFLQRFSADLTVHVPNGITVMIR